MDEILKQIKQIENQIEQALRSYEMQDQNDKAMEIYQQAETKLDGLDLKEPEPEYNEQQRVLAYCLMRQGNLLRQMGEPDQALELSEREIMAARASQDEIMLARSLMSNGTNRIVAGNDDRGLELLDEARILFESGESYDHQQGLGWYWIIQADLINAGFLEKEPSEVLEITNQIISILEPIENWVGVARAYAARSAAHLSIENHQEATRDRKKQAYYESIIEA